MKAKLIKEYGDYYLISDKEIKNGDEYVKLNNRPRTLLLGTTISHVIKVSKLSKQNCDSLFGVVDVDKLAKEETRKYLPGCPENIMNFIAHERFFKIAFNKAMELNKDKVFTLEDMIRISEFVKIIAQSEPHITAKELVSSYVQSLQQPTEIEVEIEMELHPTNHASGLELTGNEFMDFAISENYKPKIDSEGCLVLRKL